MRFSLALMVAGVLAVPGVAFANVILPPAEAKVNKATALIVQGRVSEAEAPLRAAIAKDPNEAEAHYNLGVVLRESGRFDEASGEYRAAMNLFSSGDEPNQAKCLYGIALAQEATGDPAVAAGAWHEYIRFAQRFESEQTSVDIAKNHLDGELRAANLKGPFPFGSTATRPQHDQ